MPPATTTSTSPARIIWSAISTARIEDAQTLLIVSEGSSIGRPAPTVAWREGAWPTPPWSTWPMIAYSTSPSSTPARSSAARIAIAPSSGARWSTGAPPSRPKGVRTAETMTERDIALSLASEVETGLEPLRERRDEPRGGLDVGQRDDLGRGVDVARCQRDQAGRDPGAAHVCSIHVGRRLARRDIHRVRDPLRLGGFHEQIEDLRVDRRPAVDHRPTAELRLAPALRVALGDVGRVRHVDGNRDLRAQREDARPGAAEVADLLLHRRAGGPRARRGGAPRAGAPARLCDQARGLERNERSQAVVEGARGETAVGELDGL